MRRLALGLGEVAPRKSDVLLCAGLVVVVALACKQGEEGTEQPQPEVVEPAQAPPAQPTSAAVAPPPAADDGAGWKCQAGMFSPCTCDDGQEGIHGCDNGKWLPCDCSVVAEAPPPAAGGVQVDAQGVPLIPTTRSTPPTVQEWLNALEVNTQEVNSRPPKCHMRVVREWLKVHCEGSIGQITDMTNFGILNQDYFQHIVPGKVADFVVRLQRGKTQKIRIWRGNDRATLHSYWPQSRDRPKFLALGRCRPQDSCWQIQ